MNQEISSDRLQVIQSLGRRFKHEMVMSQPNSADLKSSLSDKLNLLISSSEKQKLLSFLLNLKREIDVNYISTINPFFSYVEDMLLNVSMIVDTSTQSDSPETSGNKERTLAEIALQYVWEGKIMNRQNKEAFAKELTAEGVISLKNGDKLYNQFKYFLIKANRTGDCGSNRKNKTRYEMMVRASKYLHNPMHLATAENDIDTFLDNAEKNTGIIL